MCRPHIPIPTSAVPEPLGRIFCRRAGYKAAMYTTPPRPESTPSLWSEALWGVALIGSVLVIVAVVSALFQ